MNPPSNNISETTQFFVREAAPVSNAAIAAGADGTLSPYLLDSINKAASTCHYSEARCVARSATLLFEIVMAVSRYAERVGSPLTGSAPTLYADGEVSVVFSGSDWSVEVSIDDGGVHAEVKRGCQTECQLWKNENAVEFAEGWMV